MLWSAAPRCGPEGDHPPHENAAIWKTLPPLRSTLPRRPARRHRRRRRRRRPMRFLQGQAQGQGLLEGGGAPFPRRPLLMSGCWTPPCRCLPLLSGNRCVCVCARAYVNDLLDTLHSSVLDQSFNQRIGERGMSAVHNCAVPVFFFSH